MAALMCASMIKNCILFAGIYQRSKNMMEVQAHSHNSLVHLGCYRLQTGSLRSVPTLHYQWWKEIHLFSTSSGSNLPSTARALGHFPGR